MPFWIDPFLRGDDDFVGILIEPSRPPAKGGIADNLVFT